MVHAFACRLLLPVSVSYQPNTTTPSYTRHLPPSDILRTPKNSFWFDKRNEQQQKNTKNTTKSQRKKTSKKQKRQQKNVEYNFMLIFIVCIILFYYHIYAWCGGV